MAFELVMPRFGMTMKTAKVIQWLKEEGEFVEKDETVLVAENEKFTNDVQSLGAGILLRKVAREGEEYAIGEVLAYLGEAGEAVPPAQTGGEAAAAAGAGGGAGSAGSEPGFAGSAGAGLASSAGDAAVAAGSAGGTGVAGSEPAGSAGLTAGFAGFAGTRPGFAGDAAGAAGSAGGAGAGAPIPAAGASPGPAPARETAPGAGWTDAGGRSRVIASPLAKKLASQLGIDISRVQGRGAGGRVEKADVEEYAKTVAASAAGRPGGGAGTETGGGQAGIAAGYAAGQATRAAGQTVAGRGADQAAGYDAGSAAGRDTADAGSASLPVAAAYTSVHYTGMRKAIGGNMSQAWTNIPMVTHHVTADVGELLELREKLNADAADKAGRISVNDLLMKLTAAALVQTPVMNATFEDGEIRVYKHVNLGMATALENGLIVPVIGRAEEKNLFEIGREARALGAKARSGRLTYDDTMNGTFTVTNLGGYGSVDYFTPIINPPQAAILGVGRIRETVTPVNGEPGIRPMIALSLTYDHRIIDGAVAAEFMKILTGLMDRPFRALMGEKP